MTITLEVVKRLNMECKSLLEDCMPEEAAEISDMIVRSHKKGLVEDEAWYFFKHFRAMDEHENYFI